MKILVKNIYSWIVNPDESSLDIDFRSKMILLGQMLLLNLLFTIPVIALTEIIHYNIIRLDELLIDDNIILLLILVIFIGPIIEELIFRFPLRYKRNYLSRIIDAFINDWIFNNWKYIFKYFLYVMIVLFGLIHLTNYNNTEPIFFLLSPIIVGSQLLGGLVLSYCRIKLGLTWAILQHSLFNLIVTILAFLIFHNYSLVSKSTQKTNLEITELMYIDKETSCYSINRKDGRIYSIDAVNISLYQFMDSLQTKGPKPYDNTWINADFISKDGSTESEILEIMKSDIKFEE